MPVEHHGTQQERLEFDTVWHHQKSWRLKGDGLLDASRRVGNAEGVRNLLDINVRFRRDERECEFVVVGHSRFFLARNVIGRRGGLVALASNQNKGALTRRPSITVRSSRGILGNI